MAKLFFISDIADMVRSLPLLRVPETTASPEGREQRGLLPVERPMGERNQMRMLEEKVRRFEEEVARLRVENEQLRRSSQAFGELAERLNIALHTATRVNKRTVADVAARLQSLPSES